MAKRRVYIWQDVLSDYTPGMAVAIAGTLDSAIHAIALGDEYITRELQAVTPTIHDLEHTMGVYVTGGS